MNDIALFLGDVIINQAPNLKWVMFDKGARDIAFQRHVIMGFSKVANPKYNVDIDLLIATYGHQLVANEEVRKRAFLEWIESAVGQA